MNKVEILKQNKTGKKLLIVESPSKAKKIQEYLGKDYIVKASYGHIRDLATSGFRGNMGIDIAHDFKPYYGIIPGKVSVVEELINDAQNCDEILLFSDPDREGESISWHLNEVLKSSGKKISRLTVNEITKKAIEKAISTTGDINMNLFKSQEARRILDRIIGYMASPFLMEKFGSAQAAGRVQSVVVKMIVEREQQVNAFIPEEYWNIVAQLKTNQNVPFYVKLKNKVQNKKEADKIVNIVGNEKEFIVKTIITQSKKIQPPPPFITASIQRYMSQRHGFSPERSMQALQSLYETGYVTYIRTDSPRAAPEAITEARKWLKNNKFEFPKRSNEYSGKSTAQDAHECIRPTNVLDNPNNLAKMITPDEILVYRAIWTYFLCSQMNEAIWDTVNVTITPASNDNVIFTASGKVLAYKGYLELLNEIPNDIQMPALAKNEKLYLVDKTLKSEQKFTQPPPRYTDAALLKELEAKEIGRPATYAEIFKKITNRNYIEKQGNNYVPTELGKLVISNLIDNFSFMEYKYSALMERQLDEIAAGTLDRTQMLKEFFEPFQKKLNDAYKKLGHDICDKCGSHMVEKLNKANNNKFIACSAYPHCKNTKSVSN